MSALEHLPAPDNGLLRFLTCGSVDDGKSTLIGRLLFDTKAILADALHAIELTSRRRGLDGIDLSLLTDGLSAEREQGITIDVAYRYFSTGTRKYIIADAPGHEQYTRNMVTAASTADLAIILVDARKGVQPQTRRHSCIAQLVGIRHLVIAVNKMDLVAYSQQAFETLRRDYLDFANRIGLADVRFVPLSALVGDMVVDRGERLDWYRGPTLLEILETAPRAHSEAAEPFRFPVQYVCRPRAADDPELHDFRGYMGRVEAGTIAVGDEIRVLPSGGTARIRDICSGERSVFIATAEQSVTLLLDRELDISRGDMLVESSDAMQPRRQLDAMVCWLSETPRSEPALSAASHHARSEGIGGRHRPPPRRQYAGTRGGGTVADERHRPGIVQAGAAALRRPLREQSHHRRVHRHRRGEQ
jgi:sulfate adenylyltransferase subunit 1